MGEISAVEAGVRRGCLGVAQLAQRVSAGAVSALVASLAHYAGELVQSHLVDVASGVFCLDCNQFIPAGQDHLIGCPVGGLIGAFVSLEAAFLSREGGSAEATAGAVPAEGPSRTGKWAFAAGRSGMVLFPAEDPDGGSLVTRDIATAARALAALNFCAGLSANVLRCEETCDLMHKSFAEALRARSRRVARGADALLDLEGGAQ